MKLDLCRCDDAEHDEHGEPIAVFCPVHDPAARERIEHDKKHASLVAWFESCPFKEYSLGALEAAYKALVEWEQ